MKLRSTTIFCFQYSSRTQPPLIRHPCLNSGLFEHRVQTLLKSSRISSTSKFQTYRICSRSHRKTNHPHIQMISELHSNSYCSLLFYCPYYTKVITIKIPKYLAGCFLLLPNWGVSFYFGNLLQPACFLLLLNWGIFPYFWNLPQPACFLLLFHWGIFPYFWNLPQPACFLLLFHWGIFPYFGNLLQLACFLLLFHWGIFPYFGNLLQLAYFLVLFDWGIFPYFGNLLQPACFLLLFHWGIFLHFQVFAPTSLLPALVPLGNFPLFRKFTPTSLFQFIYLSILTLYTIYRKSHPAMPCALDRVTSPIYIFI